MREPTDEATVLGRRQSGLAVGVHGGLFFAVSLHSRLLLACRHNALRGVSTLWNFHYRRGGSVTHSFLEAL
jgi:hypothetical protein